METCKCVKCGRMFVGYSIEELDRCDKCNGELYCGEFYVDKTEVSNMNFIDAIGKYRAITRDGGTTVYSKNSEGTIIRKTNGVGGGFQLNYDLLISTGWEEHKEQKLIVPERVPEKYGTYYYVDNNRGQIESDDDYRFSIDNSRFENFNYFSEEAFAQYVADRQLIQRVELVLHQMNMFNPDILNKELLINEYVRDNYKEVLHRIKDYEMKNVEKRANRTTK